MFYQFEIRLEVKFDEEAQDYFILNFFVGGKKTFQIMHSTGAIY